MTAIYAFACRLRWHDHETIYNAPTASAAKYRYLLDVREPCPDVRFTDIRIRKIGQPHTSADFKRNAAYRGMPNVECGQRVRVGDADGVIVGHNGSANFDVLFDADSRYGGLVLNVHPCDIVLL